MLIPHEKIIFYCSTRNSPALKQPNRRNETPTPDAITCIFLYLQLTSQKLNVKMNYRLLIGYEHFLEK
jgi:hypothetical protein